MILDLGGPSIFPVKVGLGATRVASESIKPPA